MIFDFSSFYEASAHAAHASSTNFIFAFQGFVQFYNGIFLSKLPIMRDDITATPT